MIPGEDCVQPLRFPSAQATNEALPGKVPGKPVMQIPVLIEPVARNGYRAQAVEPFAVSAKGATRAEALANLRAKIERRLKKGAEIVGLEVGPQSDPWMELVGKFKNDPWIDGWKQSIEEYRQQVEDDPNAL